MASNELLQVLIQNKFIAEKFCWYQGQGPAPLHFRITALDSARVIARTHCAICRIIA